MNKKSVGMELRSLTNLIRRNIMNTPSFQYAHRLTGTNGWIMAFLHENKERDIFQRDLEENFTLTRSTISRVLKVMEEKGLVERRAVADDARLKKLVLTDKALALHNSISKELQEMEVKLTAGFSEKEKTELSSYLERMRLNLEKEMQEVEKTEIKDRSQR